MSKFKKRIGLDKSLAEAGVDFLEKDEFKNLVGTFKCRYVNALSDAGIKKLDSVKKLHNIDDDALENDQFRALAAIFIEMHLLDWDMTDEDGEPIEYSKPLAYEFFAMEENRGVLASLLSKCRTPTYFGLRDPEAIAGN